MFFLIILTDASLDSGLLSCAILLLDVQKKQKNKTEIGCSAFIEKAHAGKLKTSVESFTSISGPSDCKILMTITMGMQIMEDRAKHQPRPMAQSGYSYTLL